MRLRAFVILGLVILIALTAFPGQAQAATFTATATENTLAVAPASVSTPTLVIQDIQGIEGEVVDVDVVFSNPTGSGFSGIGWWMTIENPEIAEFVDVRLPDWVDPLFAELLMELFIAPDGFPTSSITLVVPDLLESIGGVLEDEVLATMSFRLISTGETKLLLDLLQFDSDDFSEPPDFGNLIPITEYPTSVKITVTTCTLNLGLGYADGTLTMDFELGTLEPATWDSWVVIPGTGVFPVWSLPMPVVDPSVSPSLSLPFPSIGTIGFLTALSTSEGITCSDSANVDTGTPSSSTPATEELRELFN